MKRKLQNKMDLWNEARGFLLKEIMNNKLVILITIAATIISGALLVFVFKPELYEGLDILKLILLSVCVTLPMYFLNIALAFNIELYKCDREYSKMNDIMIMDLAGIISILETIGIVVIKMFSYNDFSVKDAIILCIVYYILTSVITILLEKKRYTDRKKNM